MSLFSKEFLLDAGERAVSTFAQFFLALFTVLAPSYANINATDLITGFKATLSVLPVVLAISAVGALYSLMKSVVASFRGDKDSASLIK